MHVHVVKERGIGMLKTSEKWRTEGEDQDDNKILEVASSCCDHTQNEMFRLVMQCMEVKDMEQGE
jgi:hypothetical protein